MRDSVIAISINGEMYLIENKLSDEQIRDIESLSKEFLLKNSELVECDEGEIFEGFTNFVNDKFGIQLNNVRISHVVRINK